PVAVGTPGRKENLAIHLVERLGPVAEDVLPFPGFVPAAVNIAANYREAFAALRLGGAIVVDQDRRRQPELVAVGWMIDGLVVVEAAVTLHSRPAEIDTARDDVDFLVGAL